MAGSRFRLREARKKGWDLEKGPSPEHLDDALVRMTQEATSFIKNNRLIPALERLLVLLDYYRAHQNEEQTARCLESLVKLSPSVDPFSRKHRHLVDRLLPLLELAHPILAEDLTSTDNIYDYISVLIDCTGLLLAKGRNKEALEMADKIIAVHGSRREFEEDIRFARLEFRIGALLSHFDPQNGSRLFSRMGHSMGKKLITMVNVMISQGNVEQAKQAAQRLLESPGIPEEIKRQALAILMAQKTGSAGPAS